MPRVMRTVDLETSLEQSLRMRSDPRLTRAAQRWYAWLLRVHYATHPAYRHRSCAEHAVALVERFPGHTAAKRQSRAYCIAFGQRSTKGLAWQDLRMLINSMTLSELFVHGL